MIAYTEYVHHKRNISIVPLEINKQMFDWGNALRSNMLNAYDCFDSVKLNKASATEILKADDTLPLVEFLKMG